MGRALQKPEGALDAWSQLEADERLFELDDFPETIEHYLRLNVSGRKPSMKLWTDASLAALAEALGMPMVTFDRGFQGFTLSALELLDV